MRLPVSTKQSADVNGRLTSAAREALALAIQEAHGNEVFAVGRLSDGKQVAEIVVAARGHRTAVPALAPFIERGDVVLHNHPSGITEPSDADLRVAAAVGEQGIGFYIVDNSVSRVYVVAEPVTSNVCSAIDIDSAVQSFQPGGRLSELHPSYEVRSEQVEMVETVAGAFNDDAIAVVEAGTGVGKSLAYLVPAFLWALGNDERVVISTATINLQQQLIDKDIPLASRVVGGSVKAVLVKGRGNYVCRRRLDDALQDNVLFEDTDEELAALRSWVDTTATGSRSDLPFYPRPELWARVCSESDACLGLRCAFRGDCFVLRARKEAAEAQVIVTNHHLLFSDLSIRQAGVGYTVTAVLPPFTRLVFDEAHNIERSATSFFSEVISRVGVRRGLSALYRERKGRATGLLFRLLDLAGPVSERLKEVPDLVRSASAVVADLDGVIAHLVDRGAVRLTDRTPSQLVNTLERGLTELQSCLLSVRGILQSVLAVMEDGEEAQEELYAETRIVARRVQELISRAERFCRRDEYPDQVFWIETRTRRDGVASVRYVITPLDVTDVLREAVFQRSKSVVCTSATLTVDSTFDFWAGRAGLEGLPDRDVRYLSLPSPFPYDTNVLLAVPTDAPPPSDPQYQAFLSEGVRAVLELSEGGALVLFTSYAMLSRTYDAIAPSMNARGISVLKQGEDDRSRLLEAFTTDVSSVLCATDSFWEGVDAPGDALKVVIICRLPFRVPSNPVVEARMEAISRRGGDPFSELSVPEAVMRLKQGFGRLIRRATDRGVVVVFDNRIVRKAYGAHFTRSLPSTLKSVKELEFALGDLEAFLYPAE